MAHIHCSDKTILNLAKKHIINLEIFEFKTFISIHGEMYNLEILLKELNSLGYKHRGYDLTISYNSGHHPVIYVDSPSIKNN